MNQPPSPSLIYRHEDVQVEEDDGCFGEKNHGPINDLCDVVYLLAIRLIGN